VASVAKTQHIRYRQESYVPPANTASEAANAPSERLLHRTRVLEEQLASLRAENGELHRAFAEAAQVQRRLSVPRQFRRGNFDVAGEIFPVHQVSGDLLTSFDLGRQTVLALGDIAGKSFFAGMWFTHITGLVRIFAESLSSPAAVASAINEHLVALQPEPPLTTLFLAFLDWTSGELQCRPSQSTHLAR
jgi:serine phosphatase RsbU (regulator of sigma subunit)